MTTEDFATNTRGSQPEPQVGYRYRMDSGEEYEIISIEGRMCTVRVRNVLSSEKHRWPTSWCKWDTLISKGELPPPDKPLCDHCGRPIQQWYRTDGVIGSPVVEWLHTWPTTRYKSGAKFWSLCSPYTTDRASYYGRNRITAPTPPPVEDVNTTLKHPRNLR